MSGILLISFIISIAVLAFIIYRYISVSDTKKQVSSPELVDSAEESIEISTEMDKNVRDEYITLVVLSFILAFIFTGISLASARFDTSGGITKLIVGLISLFFGLIFALPVLAPLAIKRLSATEKVGTARFVLFIVALLNLIYYIVLIIS